MKTVIFYVVASLCLLVAKLNAQTFEERVHQISKNIDRITEQEKDSLKMEVEKVDKMLENDEISQETDIEHIRNVEARIGK